MVVSSQINLEKQNSHMKNDPSDPKYQAGAADSDRFILRPRAKPANPDIKGKKGKKSNMP